MDFVITIMIYFRKCLFLCGYSKPYGFLNKIDRTLAMLMKTTTFDFLEVLFVFLNITDSIIKSIVFDCFQENIVFFMMMNQPIFDYFDETQIFLCF